MGKPLFLFTFGLVGILLTTTLTYSYVMDDALITLRYSENLARIGQPIWNRADAAEPAMGYTSPAWMAINAVTAALTSDKDTIVRFTKLYSLLATVFLLALCVRWVTGLRYSLSSATWVIFLFFWNPVVGLHINSGMETILFGVLVFVFGYLIVSDRNYYSILACGFVCYLVRPEGGMLVALYWVLELLKNKNIRRSVLGAASLGIVLVGYHAWVYSYYGDLLPLSFYVKQASGGLFKIAGAVDIGLFALFCALPYIVITFRGGGTPRRIGVIVALQVALTLFFLTVEPLMNVAYRYQFPVLTLLLLTTILTYPHFAKSRPAVRRLLFIIVGLQWVFNFGVADMYAKKTGRAAENLASIGKALAQRNDYEAWMAYGDAGFVCYYSDFNTIDLNGLNTRAIAKSVVSKEEALNDEKIRLLLGNARFKLGESIRPRLSDGQGGLFYVGSVPVTRDSRSLVVLQFYVRGAFMDSLDVARIETSPDYEESWFESLYYEGRKLVKNR